MDKNNPPIHIAAAKRRKGHRVRLSPSDVAQRAKRSGPVPWQPPPPDQFERLAAVGLTIEEICDSLGVSVPTFYVRRTPEIIEAVKRGRARGIQTISNALFTAAAQGNITAQIFFLKCRAGWIEKQVVEWTGANGQPIGVQIYVPDNGRNPKRVTALEEPKEDDR